MPKHLQAMTVPACLNCNQQFSEDETRTAAVVCTISFTSADREAVAPGGWVHAATQRDASLREFINSRLGQDGMFRADGIVKETIARVMSKTAAGLLFYEFGRIVPLAEIRVLDMDHAQNVNPLALAERYRRDDSMWAEVTPSGRELERQVIALSGGEPPHMPEWRAYVPGFFDYMFLRRSNNRLLTAMKLHDSLTVVVECPWPSGAGPRRGGQPPRL
jgi:hypothetical protein